MDLTTSIVALILFSTGFIGFSIADKRTENSVYRMLTSLCGIMGMLAMFFVLMNIAIYFGLVK